jgi:hypothetical protein
MVAGALSDWSAAAAALEANEAIMATLRWRLAAAQSETPALAESFFVSGENYGQAVRVSAKGDPVVMERAGVPVQAPRTAAPRRVTPPLGLQASPGKRPGDLVPTWRPERYAINYVLQGSAGPPTDDAWSTLDNHARRRRALHGLPPGARFWLRIAVVTSSGQSPWSDPVNALVR